MNALHVCCWDWCRTTFSTYQGLANHVVQEHIEKAQPVRRSNVKLLRRAEEGASSGGGTIDTIPSFITNESGGGTFFTQSLTYPSTQESPLAIPADLYPSAPRPMTTPPAPFTPEHNSFSALAAQSSPSPPATSPFVSPAFGTMVSDAIASRRGLESPVPSRRVDTDSDQPSLSTSSSRDVEEQLTQNILQQPSSSPAAVGEIQDNSHKRRKQTAPPTVVSPTAAATQAISMTQHISQHRFNSDGRRPSSHEPKFSFLMGLDRFAASQFQSSQLQLQTQAPYPSQTYLIPAAEHIFSLLPHIGVAIALEFKAVGCSDSARKGAILDTLLKPCNNASSAQGFHSNIVPEPIRGDFRCFRDVDYRFPSRALSIRPDAAVFQTSEVVLKKSVRVSQQLRPFRTAFKSQTNSSIVTERTIFSGHSGLSVYDLSLARTHTAMDPSPPFSRASPGSPSSLKANSAGLGDLRALSRKPWSKSAEELGKFSASAPSSPATPNFQDRVEQYRGGSSQSPSSQRQHTFPVITMSPTPSSSSPPQSATSLSPLPSAASPNSTQSPISGGAPLLHARSHSFTPKLPSKLSGGKVGPPSPVRKLSAASDKEFDGKEKDKPAIGPAFSGRGAFPFTFGGSKGGGVQTGDTSLLPPPTIIEPGHDEKTGSIEKRSSQITYHTGFVNKLSDFTPPATRASTYAYAGPSLAKGWKPLKLVLRGTKLQFYKPPSDRVTAVKELFPSGIVSVEEEGDIEAATPSDVGNEDKGEVKPVTSRRKRAFWGRRTHPDLVFGENEGIMNGTLEALVHEAVFATTFRNDGVSLDVRRGEWQDFASSVLFALPSLVGATKLEAEFLRCCTYLVSGAEDAIQETERSRVQWLADEYLRYYGSPGDAAAWEEFRVETIPNFPKERWLLDASAMQTSSSTQALFSRSPDLDVASSNQDILSPNVDTFSPRPGEGQKMASLTNILATEKHSAPSSGKKSLDMLTRPSTSGNKEILWSALEREGFTKEILLRLGTRLVARSLFIFNRTLLESMADNLSAVSCLPDDNPTLPTTSNANAHSETAKPNVTVFFGSDDRPHWLTKLVLLHILGPDSLSLSSRTSHEHGSQTSRTHTRSEVISAWVRIGESCRVAGDQCSWRAICGALCSRPIARLEKAWKRVDPSSLSVVEAWINLERGQRTSAEAIMIPWGGDLREKIRAALDRAKNGDGEEWTVGRLKEAKDAFEGFRTTFSLCPRKPNLLQEEGSEDIDRLMTAWKNLCATGGGTGNLASQFVHVDQFMSLSVAAESRRKGLYEPYFWSRSTSSSGPSHHSLVPLLFLEHLPDVTLINRAQIWRGRLESGATQLNVQDVHFLRNVDSASQLSGARKRRSFGAAADALNADDFGGTLIPLFDGELLLLVQPGGETSISPPSSRAPSRPPSSVIESNSTERPVSRVPSMRVKPGSHGVERKTSLARRNSLPSISQRTSLVIPERISERPVRAIVKAGTLERLVEILAHGLPGVSVSIADDNGEMPLREGMTREVRLDRVDFASVWWNVYRSFVTPLVFFELLRKRYVSVSLAGQSGADELRHIALIRSEILEVMSEWLKDGGGAQDILDDGPLFHAVQAFFTSTTDHDLPESMAKVELNVSRAWSNLHNIRISVASLFVSQTMRPTIQSMSYPDVITISAASKGFGVEPPDLDKVDPVTLVNNLTRWPLLRFATLLKRYSFDKDLFVTADLLEVQTADRMGWFLTRDASTTSDDVEIQTIYSHMSEIEPSTMISELTQDSIFRLLPPGLRSCLRAHHVLRKWLVSRLVSPRLGIQVRQARMELILQAIEICRRRSLSDSPDDAFPENPCIRSFVEFVLTSAVLSVESRIHQRAWYNVANSRKVGCDNLLAYLARPVCQPSQPNHPLKTDMGWTLERMLEIISLPDVHEPMSPESRPLVNFDKRRQLCNLISSSHSVSASPQSRPKKEIDRRDFERLGNIEREVGMLHFDLRSIKEDAYREMAQAGASGPPRRSQRPFQKHVAVQHEKNKRDRYLRDRLSKERKQEQLRSDKRDEYLNKAMHTRRPYTTSQRQHRMKKSASSGFFQQLIRPISSAFSLDNVDSPMVKRTAAELDFTPTGKPSLVLNVVDARVAHFINYDRSYTFQLDTEDGGHYLLQAASRLEMIKWVETIDRVSKSAAKRRLTYLGNSPKPQLADHIHDRPKAASRDPTALFGVDLEFLLRREANGSTVPPGAIPSAIERCLLEVEARGLSEVGIYRIAGASSEVNGLKEKLNRGEWPITSSTDIYAVCDIIKTWFRVLPEPVFPSYSYHDIIDAMKIEDFNTRIERIRTVVRALHRHNFDLLKRVVEHLDRVTDYEEHNQMGSDALAIVFSPNLLRAPHNDFVMIMSNMQYTNKLVKALVTHVGFSIRSYFVPVLSVSLQFHTIFDETDPDAEVDHDEDEEEAFEEPIPEEDEETDVEPLRSSPMIYPGSENLLASQFS
ncbi:hypothetical protein EW146_g880 [Bondarzewia mesenterica]|uniref:C2H2-type domain-containing protein n=1 Tax=Bondarzewia mesenterica TaxID=1095465 RepID=A0A4S4M7F6_9AGAM|nr:hypothetical protein EW146_g880 [Bondarzewia mesenterica]